MIKATVRDALSPTVGSREWRLNEIGQRFDAAKVFDDLVGKPVHGLPVAIIATRYNPVRRVNRDISIEPDGDNAYMDLETLKRLMSEHGDSQAAIARMIGITRDKMNKVMLGKRRLTVEEATKIARHYGTESALDSLPKLLPIIGLVSAGSWREAIVDPRGYMPSPDRSLGRDAFVVITEGDSMDLVAQDGEAVIVDPNQRELLAGRYYIIQNGDGEATFKRYMENPARFEPCSTNPAHKPIIVGGENFTIVGRVRKKVVDL